MFYSSILKVFLLFCTSRQSSRQGSGRRTRWWGRLTWKDQDQVVRVQKRYVFMITVIKFVWKIRHLLKIIVIIKTYLFRLASLHGPLTTSLPPWLSWSTKWKVTWNSCIFKQGVNPTKVWFHYNCDFHI
jgi:hypothetical protein